MRYTVQRLKTLCPSMGKVKIALTLARAGLDLGSTTVGRMLKEQPVLPTKKVATQRDDVQIAAKYDRPCAMQAAFLHIL